MDTEGARIVAIPAGRSQPLAAVAAFEPFYADQYPRVVATLVALTGDRAVAEELAQEAFVRAYRSWAQVGTYERPGGWVRTVAVNLAHSRFRRLRAERRASARAGQRDHVDAPEPTDPRFAQVWDHVRRLPRQQATAIALRYVDDLSTTEIAEVMGCAEATVRVHLHRATKRLAAALAMPAPVEEQRP